MRNRIVLLWLLMMIPGGAAPLTLDDAVHVALAHRPELQAAAQDVAMKQAEWRSRQAELRPAASLSANGVSQNTGMILATTPPVAPTFYASLPPGTLLDVDVVAMWPLYSGGRLQQQVASALVETHIAEDQAEAEVDTVVRGVRQAYMGVLEAQAELQVRDASVSEDTEATRLARLRFQTGKVAAVEVTRAESELEEAREAQNDAVAQVEEAMADLSQALGLSQAAAVTLDARLPAAGEIPDLAALTIMALQHRPDLQAARLGVASAAAEVEVARSAFRPSVALVGMGQSTSVAGQGVPGGTSMAVTASIPVFDGGLRHQQVLEAEANLEKQSALVQAMAWSVERDVRKASAAVKAQKANLEISEAGLRAAEETDRIAHLRVNLGAGIQLEVLDAQATLVRARLNRLKALYGYQEALADLDWSTGQSWPPPVNAP